MNQAQLDAALDRAHIISVSESNLALLPRANQAYDTLRDVIRNGLPITARKLIHAIGSKTAAIPSSSVDECLRAGLLYTYVLDLNAPHLRFKDGITSDLQTPRSQEIGIGLLCLLAEKCFRIPWDQLGALPGRGLRFDYRGQAHNLDGIFEAKGTSHRSNQPAQIRNGVDKKGAHHNRGERFNVELIVSSCIGRGDVTPAIIAADPNFDDLAPLYERADRKYFRLRHYVRVLQFLGLPKSAFLLNKYAAAYLNGERVLRYTILDEKGDIGFLERHVFNGELYFGRWFSTVLPGQSTRFGKRYSEEALKKFRDKLAIRVFQGIRSDFYQSAFGADPFSIPLLSEVDVESSKERVGQPSSVFPDGTIQVFAMESDPPNDRVASLEYAFA